MGAEMIRDILIEAIAPETIIEIVSLSLVMWALIAGLAIYAVQ